MAVRKRSGKWHYDFMIRRVRYRGSIPEAQTKRQAEQAEARIRIEVYEGRYGRPSGEEMFIKYAEEKFLPWSRENKRSYGNDVYHIETFRSFFGSKSFKEITPILIEKFKRDRFHGSTRYHRQRRPASVNRELQLLSKIFNLAIRDGIADSNPCEKVTKLREDNKRTRYLSVEEERALFRSLDGVRAHLKPIVLIAIHTGMRRGEILKLRWSEVDFARSIILVTRTKTGKDRVVPMNDVVREELLTLKHLAPQSEVVFVSVKTGRALTEIKRGFTAACREAGIMNLRFHDLRHTFGTRLADAGTDAFTIAELMGHADLRMTARYTHATDQNRRRAVERLAQYGQSEKDCLKIVTNEKRKAG